MQIVYRRTHRDVSRIVFHPSFPCQIIHTVIRTVDSIPSTSLNPVSHQPRFRCFSNLAGFHHHLPPGLKTRPNTIDAKAYRLTAPFQSYFTLVGVRQVEVGSPDPSFKPKPEPSLAPIPPYLSPLLVSGLPRSCLNSWGRALN